jgi:DNA repair photolyase
MTKAVAVDRRTRIIHDFPYHAGRRTCPHAAIVNITKSGHCFFDCVYCYAKSYPWSYSGNAIEVYQNTPELLDAELSGIRTCPPLYFCAVTDPFQPLDLVFDTALRSMSIAVKHNVFFTVVTKSDLVLQILETKWRDYERFRVSVTCESINDKKLRVLSNAPAAFKRLAAIEELIDTGVDVVARVDPIIAGYTDDRDELCELFEALNSIGIKSVTISTGTFRKSTFDRLTSRIYLRQDCDSVDQMKALYVLEGRYHKLDLANRLDLYRFVDSLCGRYCMTLSICQEKVDPLLFRATRCTTLGQLTVKDQCGHFTPRCRGDCLAVCPDKDTPPCANKKLAMQYPYKWSTLL